MTMPPLRLRFVLGALGVLAVLTLLVFDANWARPLLVQYLHHTSQRTLQIDDLQLRLDARWRPVVRLRGVRIANAPWAGPAPLIVAREASFTFAWAHLLDRVRVVTEMRLVDAEVDLERQADGLRNWRLTRPDDRGPARIRVMRLVAERTQLRVVHQGVQLVLQARSSPLPTTAGQGDGFTQRVDFSGTLRGAPFEGHALSGPQIHLYDTGEPFALRGDVQAGTTRLTLDGRITDLLQLAALDARVSVRGETLAALKPFMPRPPWPVSKPYRFEGTLAKEGPTWTAREASLHLGHSELAGSATYTRRAQRNVIEARVDSRALHLDDLPRQPEGHGASAPPSAPARPTTRVLPQTPVPLDGLRELDGHVVLQVASLHLAPRPASRGADAREVKAEASLDQGRLTVALQQAQVAGGTLRGHFTLDAGAAGHADANPPAVRLELQAQGLKLDDLWPPLAPTLGSGPGVEGPVLQGRATLSGGGPSLAAWLGSASGRVDLGLAGGSLSRKLDARLGLSLPRMLGALFAGDQPVPIRCGAASIVFEHGVGRSRSLVLATTRTLVEGQASVHLGDESWAVLLTPQPQGAAPLVLPASIVAQGTFRRFDYGLSARRQPQTAASGDCTRPCAAASASGCG
ncbi:MAG: hypothetical protein KF891_13450 [Rhizobacter sp.]|nr:hypothetical protein [Rhizobacter sp.]